MPTVERDGYTITQDKELLVTLLRGEKVLNQFQLSLALTEQDLMEYLENALSALKDVFSPKSLALVFSRFTYRDTPIIENSHSEKRKINMEFYEQVKASVNKSYWELKTAIEKFFEKKPPKTQLEEQIITVLFVYSRNGDEWDEPFYLDLVFEGNVADCVLSGEFKKACETEELFNSQSLMKRLNKDIYNRFYTLLCDGYILNN